MIPITIPKNPTIAMVTKQNKTKQNNLHTKKRKMKIRKEKRERKKIKKPQLIVVGYFLLK